MLRAGPHTIETVVIQASPFCNIDCRYCYLPQRQSRTLLDEGTLAKIYERIFASAYLGPRLQNLWHAGEPLAVPLEFYQRALRLEKHYNCGRVQVEHVFQTNGTLIDQRWCDFFREHEIRVGLSLDGPQALHDAQRVTRSGQGTFARTLQGLERLKANGIPVHLLAVLTRDSLASADAIWDFFRSLDCASWSFNIEEVEGVHTHSSVGHADDAERYQNFFRRLRELRAASGDTIRIREIDTMDERVRYGGAALASQLTRPLAIVSFDCQGNISTFSPELLGDARRGGFAFGNVFDCAIDEILERESLLAVQREIEKGVDKCRTSCPYFSVCGGGTPANKLAEHGTFDVSETTHCRLTIQALCDVVLEGVERELGIAAAG